MVRRIGLKMFLKDIPAETEMFLKSFQKVVGRPEPKFQVAYDTTALIFLELVRVDDGFPGICCGSPVFTLMFFLS